MSNECFNIILSTLSMHTMSSYTTKCRSNLSNLLEADWMYMELQTQTVALMHLTVYTTYYICIYIYNL